MKDNVNAVTIHDLDLRVGLAIKRLRQNAGMTQIELAEKLGVSQSCISLAERGRRTTRLSLKVYQQIAAVLGMKQLSALIKFAEDMGPAHQVVQEAESILQ